MLSRPTALRAGGRPLAITDCLNFGNPEKPDIAWELVEAIEGMSLACEALGVPVGSGNVSLYNETDGRAIYPTPAVGWVGLVVPHMARLLVGPEFSRLLPVAALFGAIFMLVIDTIARTLTTIQVPPGILTAVVGTPVFIALLARARRMF